MHLRSLSLRNYRVYRSVDLEFPDGLIGIYGANGSGQDHLIEALRYGIYGDARTDKWELRSAGVGEDVRVELVFEHEGNTYDAAAAEGAQPHPRGRGVPERAAGRPVGAGGQRLPGQVLGMDQGRSWPRCAPSRRS